MEEKDCLKNYQPKSAFLEANLAAKELSDLIYSHLSPGAKVVMEKLETAHYPTYLVGGSLRDLLLGKAIHDFDFATLATPLEMQAVFRDYRLIETGIKHGTVTVLIAGNSYEITTFRQETTYSDHRHPDGVIFAKDVETDLARRDFTINALAWSKQTGLIDLFGGLDDLKNGLIRTVGKADERFHEDALRILRGLRFAACLDFQLAESTALAIKNKLADLNYVAKERIISEWDKLWLGKGMLKIMRDFQELGSVNLTSLGTSLDGEQLLKTLTTLKKEENQWEWLEQLISAKKAPEPDWQELKRVCFWLAYCEAKKMDLAANGALNKLAQDLRFSNQRKQLLQILAVRLNYAKIQHFQVSDLYRALVEFSFFDVAFALTYASLRGRDVKQLKACLVNLVQANLPVSFKDVAYDGNLLLQNFPKLWGTKIKETLQLIHLKILKKELANNEVAITHFLKEHFSTLNLE